jgi:hypothetical protein
MRAERGEMSLGPVVAVVLLVGILATLPIFLMVDRQERALDAGLEAASSAKDLSAQNVLRDAMTGAQVYFAERGSYVGFTAEVAAQYEPSSDFTTGAAAPGRVSIRGISDTTIVMVTKSGSGALCVAATYDVVSYGRVDATSASSCSGGW